MKKTLVPVLALALLALSAPLFAMQAAPSPNPAPATAAPSLAPAPVPAAQPDARFALWLTAGRGPDMNPSLNCQCFVRGCPVDYVCCTFTVGHLTSCDCVPADGGCGQ
jgi:hypothetical protein